jgi:BlaI family transcriptional regulator, penicillinase repressor
MSKDVRLTLVFTDVIYRATFTSVVATAVGFFMKPSISISEAESVVMQVLWRTSPIATEEVIAALEPEGKWQDSTVKTLLNRLLKKGAISARKDGRRYLYSPVLKRKQWLSNESSGFLDRLFDGRVAPLVAHFSQQRKLGKNDIAELKRLIQELDDEQ